MKILKYLVMVALFTASGLIADCSQCNCLNRYIMCSKTNTMGLYAWDGNKYGAEITPIKDKTTQGSLCPNGNPYCHHSVFDHMNENSGFPITVNGTPTHDSSGQNINPQSPCK